jgi:parallel beta-helix repeat protein
MAERLTHLAASVAPLLSFMPGVNVQTFGATGDGSTDDTVALQDAISGSGTLWIPAGDYVVSRPLELGSNTRLIAQSGATFYRIAGIASATMPSIISQSNGSNILIEGLTIDGQVDTYASGDVHGGIVLTNCSNATIRYCVVTRTVNAETTAGIHLVDCYDSIIDNCYLYDNDKTAVIITGGARNKIVHSTANNNAGSGFATTGGSTCTDCEIVDCTAVDNGYSCISANGIRGRVVHNYAAGSVYTGINIGHAGSSAGDWGHNADDSVVADNICESNTLDGIMITGSKRVIISHNQCRDNARHGLRLFKSTDTWDVEIDNCTIDHNRFTQNGAHGCFVEYGKYHIIDGNEFQANTTSGLYISAPSGSGIIHANIMRNNAQGITSGSGLVLAANYGYIVTNNQFIDDQATATQGYGIWVAGGGDHSIGANRFSGNKVGTIRETSTPSGMTYFDNVPAYP